MTRTNKRAIALSWAAWALVQTGCGGGGELDAPTFAEDLEWLALVDGDDAGSIVHDEEPRGVRLSDYAASGRPGTKAVVLLAAAGWCAPCQAEASVLSSFVATYEPQGVSVLTAVIQDAQSNPADVEFGRLWAETFSLTIPTLIDSDFTTSRYFDIGAMPSAMLIDAQSLEILSVTIGADTGSDPLGKYRDLLDYHLSRL